MTRATWRRRFEVAGIALALTLVCAACAPFTQRSGSDEERASEVIAAVQAADTRVVEASAEQSTNGFSSGWLVDLVLDSADPVTSDELSGLLMAVRHAGDRDPGHVDFFATDESGASIDLTAAADALELPYSAVGAGITVVSDDIDDTLGTHR